MIEKDGLQWNADMAVGMTFPLSWDALHGDANEGKERGLNSSDNDQKSSRGEILWCGL